MKVVYASSIFDKIRNIKYNAAFENRKIDYILLSEEEEFELHKYLIEIDSRLCCLYKRHAYHNFKFLGILIKTKEDC